VWLTVPREWKQIALVSLRALALILIVFVVASGAQNGVSAGRGIRSLLQQDDLVAAHVRDAPNSLLQKYLVPGGWPGQIRNLDELAQAHHLSFFATAEAERLARTKLPEYTYQPPRTRMVKPNGNAVLHGPVYLVASASSEFSISTVAFRILGTSAEPPKVIPAKPFQYGWIGAWSTTDVANGTYTIESVARESTGHLAQSPPVPVMVEN
jgi:hypothetical protein